MGQGFAQDGNAALPGGDVGPAHRRKWGPKAKLAERAEHCT
jgi:hypothetical protein